MRRIVRELNIRRSGQVFAVAHGQDEIQWRGILRLFDMERPDRERLQQAGYLQPVIKAGTCLAVTQNWDLMRRWQFIDCYP